MNKVELLSPAGNFDCLKAAINNGADAVYLGGDLFSARAFANNFNDDQMIEAVNYAHLRNVKVYVTLNTLLNEFEIDKAFEKAKFYYKHNVDALIIQDLGLFYRIRKELPDFELHASTQMHIHNVQGIKNAKELGFKRVVVARESSLNQIKEFTKQDVEIECFVHGAICVSYSGQCLMSSVTKNRSANKGMCAQCCRLKYNLYEKNKHINTDTEYLLSPKDMFLLEDIPNLINAGVTSFKIEGRMKSSAYVGYVTRIYRKAIDAFYKNTKFKLKDNEFENLKLLYNRGFTNTYLNETKDELFANIRPNHMGIEIGKVVNSIGNRVFIKLLGNINQFDGIRILSNVDTGLILNMIKVNDKFVSNAQKGEIIEIEVKDKVKNNDIVLKTYDYKLENYINSIMSKCVDIHLDIKLEEGKPILISYNDFIYKSVNIVEKALKSPITKSNIEECFLKTDKHPYNVYFDNIEVGNCFIPIKTLNEIRRNFYDSLDEYLLNRFKRNDNNELNIKNTYKEDDLNILSKEYLDPVINKDSIYFESNNFVSEFGGLLLNGRKDAYYTLNITNSYAYELLKILGFKNIVLSTELNELMINKLVEAYKVRNSIEIVPYVVTKGHRTLMYISRNPFEAYVKNHSNIKLSDGNNVYNVHFNKDHVELIDISEVSINKDLLLSYKKYEL